MNKSILVGVVYPIILVFVVCGIGLCLGWDYAVGYVVALIWTAILLCWIIRGYREKARGK